MSIFKRHSPSKEWTAALDDASNDVKIHLAYEALTNVIKDKETTEIKLIEAIEKAIIYLEEVLE